MTQYIPKSALVVEIENRIDRCNTKKWSCPANTQVEAICDNKIYAYKEILSFLYTTEVKNVDLEKELIEWHKEHFKKDGTFIGMSGFYLTNNSQLDIAKHFLELGLQAQIMTPKLQQRIGVLKMGFWTGLQTFEETEMTLSDAYNQGIDDILEELGLKARQGE